VQQKDSIMHHELTVQLERLEPMRVATISVTSDSPEDDAGQALLNWARPQGLLNKPFRFFGYDNCQPPPNHTYTTWLTVDPTVQASDDVEIKDFPGGLYAVTEIQGTEQIAPTWDQLSQWLNQSGHSFGGQTCLEECLNILDNPAPADMRFKLYLSLKS
jgi:DNA gyrase inhibitor GyrI